jgi:hypothetical protein
MPVITAILIENSDNEYLYVYYNIKAEIQKSLLLFY